MLSPYNKGEAMTVRGQVSVIQVVTLASLIVLSGWWILSIEKTINWWGFLAVVAPMSFIGMTLFMFLITLNARRKLIVVEYVMLVLATGATYWFVNSVLPTIDWFSLGRAAFGAILLSTTLIVGARTFGSAKPLRATGMEVESA